MGFLERLVALSGAGEAHEHPSRFQQFGRRALLQNSTVEVSTPSELVDALAGEAQDILITNHMDLTNLPLLPTGICPDGCETPLGPVKRTRSIRGACDDASTSQLSVPPPALVPLRPGQCIILSGEDTVSVLTPEIWLDNLYLRVLHEDESTRENAFISLVAVPPLKGPSAGTGIRYMTRMTFQGDDLGPAVGVFGDTQQKVFIEDSLFLHLGGSQVSNCQDCSSAVVSRNAHVALKSCTFRSPYEAPGSRYILVNEGGSVLLENCTFVDAETRVEVRASSTFFSDDPSITAEGVNKLPVAPAPLEDIPEPSEFLTRDDPWFAELRNELTGEPLPPPAPAALPPPSPTPSTPDPTPSSSPAGSNQSPVLADSLDEARASPPGSSSSDSQNLAAILGTVGALLIIAIAVVLFLVFSRRRKRRREQAASEKAGAGKLNTESSAARPQGHSALPPGSMHDGGGSMMKQQSHLSQSPHVTNGSDAKEWRSNSAWGQEAMHAGSLSMHSTMPQTPSQHQSPPKGFPLFSDFTVNEQDTFLATRDPSMPSAMTRPTGATLRPPGEGASAADRLDFLHNQLDTLGADNPLMKRFILLGHSHRRQGGQGLVAFARGVHDQLDYAIKFFLVHESFAAEQKLYESNTLGALLPQVEMEYDPHKSEEVLRDARGAPLPPFIVMEKGECLSDWTDRAHPELFQGIAVLVHVATRLRDMHAAGYVHRDIKPGNIMLLPRKNSWTVIDFGCTARTGEHAPLSFTVQYAAPEVVEAYLDKETTIVATEAMDAWAMGVVAFELLTGGNAFSFVKGSKQIIKQLQGQEQLPWEGEQGAAARRKLGIFGKPILSLLQRAPAERATLAGFCKSCREIFAVTSTDPSNVPLARQ